MIRIYCDICDKEIEDDDFVEQIVNVMYDKENSADGLICKECWEKPEKNMIEEIK